MEEYERFSSESPEYTETEVISPPDYDSSKNEIV